jgi:hypothetical protein
VGLAVGDRTIEWVTVPSVRLFGCRILCLSLVSYGCIGTSAVEPPGGGRVAEVLGGGLCVCTVGDSVLGPGERCGHAVSPASDESWHASGDDGFSAGPGESARTGSRRMSPR